MLNFSHILTSALKFCGRTAQATWLPSSSTSLTWTGTAPSLVARGLDEVQVPLAAQLAQQHGLLHAVNTIRHLLSIVTNDPCDSPLLPLLLRGGRPQVTLLRHGGRLRLLQEQEDVGEDRGRVLEHGEVV